MTWIGWLEQLWTRGRQDLRGRLRLLGLSVLVGMVAGLAAIVFLVACEVIQHLALDGLAGWHVPDPKGDPPFSWLPDLGQPFRPALLLLVTAVGGLLTGFIVYRYAPEAEGHGTDAVIAAYHRKQGQMRPRVPLIKILASAITLGTGGSGGREGPIAQVGAGFGAFLANLLHLRPKERRILLAAGMGSGIGAIFHAPLAGALFAAEVLYSSSDFEAEVIVPAGIASTISYCTYGLFFGFGPLFGSTPLSFTHSLQLAPYLILAVGMILLAMVYVRTFCACQQLFHRLPLPNLLKPAIGAFLNGCVGVALYYAFGRNEQALGVLSFGYGFLQDSLSRPESLGIPLLLAVAFGKIVTTSLTIGSGGSAGVFGASMVIGGSAGGAVGLLLQQWWPQLVPQPAAFVVVGMAGFFAAAAKTPFSTLVMVAEMTGSYTLLLPALGVCMITFLFADRRSIYGAQVDSRSRSPAHQGSYLHDVLQTESVRRFLAAEAEFPALQPAEPLSRVVDLLGRSPHSVVPVLDADHRLLGVVSLEELPAVVPDQAPADLTARQLMRRVAPLAVDDRLDRAVELFVENDLPALPVTDADGHVLGIVHRADVASAYMKLVQQRE